MKCYLAGPMSGIDDFNFPAFESAFSALSEKGIDVVSPHRIEHHEPQGRGTLPYATYIRAGLKLLLECDVIILLPGWQRSKGALIEMNTAKACQMGSDIYVPRTKGLVPYNR